MARHLEAIEATINDSDYILQSDKRADTKLFYRLGVTEGKYSNCRRRSRVDKAKTLNCHYDREEDIPYVTLGDSDSALCIEQGDGFLVRIDPESGEVLGFTVIDFSQRAAERVATPVYDQFVLPQEETLIEGVET